jgi:hypothetical protein
MTAMANFKIARVQKIGFDRGSRRVLELFRVGACETYKEMYKALLADGSVYTAGFSNAMIRLGNDAQEIFYDCESIQKRWAAEHNLNVGDDWKVTIAIAQLKKLRPDVLYFQDIFTLPEKIRRQVKVLVPSAKIVVIQKGYPGETRDLSDADILLVSSPILYERYRKQSPYLLYHSFDADISQSLMGRQSIEREQLVFAGSSRAPEDRYWMLRQLLKETPIKIWVDEDHASHKKHGGRLNYSAWKRHIRTKLVNAIGANPNGISGKLVRIISSLPKVKRICSEAQGKGHAEIKDRELPGLRRGLLPRRTLAEEFPSRSRPSLFGFDYYKLLSRSDVVFNIHSAKSQDTVDNMKMFETTGMGACLLTDTGRNMKDLFEEDVEVVAYRSADEAIEKAKYLIENPEKAREIAAAGRAKTLARHTMFHRCEAIDEIIKTRL